MHNDITGIMHAMQEAFGISLQGDAPATVQQLEDQVLTALETSPCERIECFSWLTYHRLRRGLMSMGHAPDALRPDSPLNELLPLATREADLQRLSAETGLIMPELQRPEFVLPLQTLLFFLVVAAAVVLSISTGFSSPFYLFIGSCAAATAAVWVLNMLTISLKKHLPGMTTLRDFAERVLQQSRRRIIFAQERDALARPPTEAEVRRIVKGILEALTERGKDELTPGSRIIED